MLQAKKTNYLESPDPALRFPELAALLAELGRNLYGRGWALGTSGNLSAVVCRNPLRLAITHSGVHKGMMTADHIVQIDAHGKTVDRVGRPSAEALLHLAVVRLLGANAVVHTHSVWSTIISEVYASDGGVNIEGYEMLKGLDGIQTHDHREWLPILENSQEYGPLTQSLEEALKQYPHSHGFLLRRHGLYTWGQDLPEAKRHVEILEFLLEVMGRTLPYRQPQV